MKNRTDKYFMAYRSGEGYINHTLMTTFYTVWLDDLITKSNGLFKITEINDPESATTTITRHYRLSDFHRESFWNVINCIVQG